jgi:hypothetical protein
LNGGRQTPAGSTGLSLTLPASRRASKAVWQFRLRLGCRLGLARGRRNLGIEFVVFWKAFDLIDEHQRMLRWDFDLLPAALAGHLVVDTEQVVAELGELGAILIVSAWRKPVALDPADPTDAVFVRTSAPRALVSPRPGFRFLAEEGAFVESHTSDCSNEAGEARNPAVPDDATAAQTRQGKIRRTGGRTLRPAVPYRARSRAARQRLSRAL